MAQKHARGVFGNLSNLVFLLLMAGIFMFPLVFIIARAFMPLDELLRFPPLFFPRNPTFQNFVDLANLMAGSWVPFGRYIFNTVFITVVGSFGHIMVASLAAYVLAKHKFPGATAMFTIVIFSLMFAPQVTMIPNYLILTRLRFIDTYWALIIPAFALPIGLFLMKQFMEQLHDSLLESAKIDGANELTIFMVIAMPMVKPAWLTLMIISVQQMWNMDGRSYIFTEQYKMLPIAFQQIVQGGIARTGPAAVNVLVMLIVPLTVFLINQARMVETMATSGLKE
ncbi:MAG: carbohydrate ABC transporter permease [Spirochaetales bacterium]|nr:carbohydrate ABC transporter permease [Spirochaetales bacterium]